MRLRYFAKRKRSRKGSCYHCMAWEYVELNKLRLFPRITERSAGRGEELWASRGRDLRRFVAEDSPLRVGHSGAQGLRSSGDSRSSLALHTNRGSQ